MKGESLVFTETKTGMVGVLEWNGGRESCRIEQHVDGDNHSFVVMEINNNGHMRQALSPELAMRISTDLRRAIDGLAATNEPTG
jgi:hypothetical protein